MSDAPPPVDPVSPDTPPPAHPVFDTAAPPAALPVTYGLFPPPRRRSRWWLWLLGGLVTFALLCAGGFAWIFFGGISEVEPVVTSFQALLDAGDLDRAYAEIGPEWKAVDSKADFVDLETVIRDTMGASLGRSSTFKVINRFGGARQAVLTYHAIYQNGPADVTFTASDSTGQWRIIGHRIDSPLITAKVTCQKCGTVQTGFGKFCPKCGNTMRP